MTAHLTEETSMAINTKLSHVGADVDAALPPRFPC
jgi:hypothetical protein